VKRREEKRREEKRRHNASEDNLASQPQTSASLIPDY
jgi:hypothetical protein